MLDLLRAIIRILILVIISLVVSIVIIRVLAARPGIIIAFSMLAIGVFSVALYKGSFSAVGLHTTKSIKLAVIVSICLFILSSAIFLFGLYFK